MVKISKLQRGLQKTMGDVMVTTSNFLNKVYFSSKFFLRRTVFSLPHTFSSFSTTVVLQQLLTN